MTTLGPLSITTFASHGLSKAPYLVKHIVRFRAAKAENKALARIRSRVSGGQRPQPKTFLRGADGNLPVGQAWRERDHQMHTGFRAQDLYLGAELFPERLCERIAAFRVQLPGFPDVPRKMTFVYEIGERRLIKV
jgi:hypothetical protein